MAGILVEQLPEPRPRVIELLGLRALDSALDQRGRRDLGHDLRGTVQRVVASRLLADLVGDRGRVAPALDR